MKATLPERFARAQALGGGLPGDGTALAAALARAAAAGESHKDEPGTLLLRGPLPDGGRGWWKLYRVPAGRRLLAARVRSRACREAAALAALAARGVPAVEPLAWAEERSGGRLLSSLLVTRDVEGATDLRALLQAAADAASRKAWLAAAGRLARRLHEAGCGHFRLQARNILLRPGVAGSDAHLLDAPYTCVFPGPAPPRVRAVDLVDLAGRESPLDVEDARLLLRAYASAGPEAAPIGLSALRRRPAPVQKALRIGLYLLAVNTGHRPPPPGGYPPRPERP